MGKLLFIDSDDINGLSEALKDALERRGVVFKNNGTVEFGKKATNDYDYDPWLFQESGGVRYNSGSCGHTPSVSSYGGCGGGGCGRPSYGGCGYSGWHC